MALHLTHPHGGGADTASAARRPSVVTGCGAVTPRLCPRPRGGRLLPATGTSRIPVFRPNPSGDPSPQTPSQLRTPGLPAASLRRLPGPDLCDLGSGQRNRSDGAGAV